MKKLLLLGLGIAMLFATSCNIGMGIISYDDASKYSVMLDSQTIETEITELDIGWQTGMVDISVHDEAYVLISETANEKLISESRLHYYLDGTKLKLQFGKSGFSAGSSLKKDLVIRLPRTTKLTDFVINDAASEIKFADISTDNATLQIASGTVNGNFVSDISKFSLDSASGDYTIKAKTVDSLVIDSASGDFDFTGDYIKNVELNATSGDHFIKSTDKAIDSLSVNKTSGVTDVYIPENDGFVVKFNKISGNITTTFVTSDSKKEKGYGNKSRVYNVNITSGDFNLIKLVE